MEPGTSLTVWVYDTAMGAAAGEVRLKDLQQQSAVSVVAVSLKKKNTGAEEPRVGHLRHSTTGAAAKGSALGAMVGTLFLSPVVGAAAGAGIAALAQRIRGSGIDASFLEELKGSLSPGTSALLVLSSDADLDVVRPFIERGLARGDVRLMHARLPQDAPAALRALVEDASNGDDPGGSGLARSG